MNTAASTTALLSLVFLRHFSVGFTPLSTTPSRHHNDASTTRTTLTRQFVSAISSNEDLLPGIQAIDQGNPALFDRLENLRDAPYFRLYSVDILASCEYLPQELFECYTEGCEILPLDEEEVPESIRGVDQNQFDFELDGWARWDMPTEDYYDIQEYFEGYTGYDGSDVWKYIHNRICFSDNSGIPWKYDFNKAVSGLHSMISAQVIRGIQEKLDSGEPFDEKEVWQDPRVEFNRRLSAQGENPLAVENLYFVFMLLLTAVSKAQDRLLQECNEGRIDPNSANELRALFQSELLLNHPAIGAAVNKLQQNAASSSSNLWEARMRSRELSRIMNCVQCNKCRLHGKISTMGLSTALQLLVGNEGMGTDPRLVTRVQLSTLVTTLHKCSRAIQYCQMMQ